MPEVSVCIPTYNRKEYLKETLDSILAQTYTDYEIVIVDDGSTDGTAEMLTEMGFSGTYYRQENAGESAARNKLIELAQGEFITFIDSDDLLYPYALDELTRVINKHTSNIIAYSSYTGIDEDGNEVKRKKRKLPSGNIAPDLFEYIYVHSCGTLCTKKILQEATEFDVTLPVCSPYLVWLELSLKYPFVATEKPTFKRRRHSGNLSEHSFANRKIELGVLENFYYNGGGKEVIQQRRAMRRLSKEGYRAGRCALRERLPNIPCQMLSQSFYRYPNFKSLLWWMIATGRSIFDRV